MNMNDETKPDTPSSLKRAAEAFHFAAESEMPPSTTNGWEPPSTEEMSVFFLGY